MMRMHRIVKKIFEKLYENLFDQKWGNADAIDQQTLFKSAFAKVFSTDKKSARIQKIKQYDLDALDLSLMIDLVVNVYESNSERIKSPSKYQNLPVAMELLKITRHRFEHSPQHFQAQIWNDLDKVLEYFKFENKRKQMSALRKLPFGIKVEQVCSHH